MSKLKSGLLLGEGEEVIMELEAELWAEGSNIIQKIIGQIRKLVNFLLGFKREGFIVITNKRVVEITSYRALWVLNQGREVKILTPGSIKEVGYIKMGMFCGCFCQAYQLYYESFTQRNSVLLSSIDSEDAAQKLVDSFYQAIFGAKM
ncbi:MAG: hypothetical protein J6V62_00365 [Paludibacteraceae bacterium]|nr:hypothetical protein [Paludibacteraceae bacterium]